MASNWQQRERYARISDAIAIGHFVICILVVLLGAVTPLFSFMHHPYAGLQFVYRYIDLPVYNYLQNFNAIPSDPFYTYLIGVMVISGSTFLYWMLSFIVLKAFLAFFD